jgi:hypothetical protein
LTVFVVSGRTTDMLDLFNRLSDRLLEAVAPKVTADACACRGGYWQCDYSHDVMRYCSDDCNCVAHCGPWQLLSTVTCA